jgi:hypothetical protein
MMTPRDDDTTRTATSTGIAVDRSFATDAGHEPPTLPPRFEPLRRLGGGGQGEVWLALDNALAQHVALKVVSRGPDGPPAGRARREARLGRSLAHPNLVRIFDLIEDDDHDIVVMEWIVGGAITDRPDRLPMPIEDVIDVGDQLLAALTCLHRAGVVHRDVKPSNVLIPEPGRYVLGDLGLVRSPDEVSDLTVTATGIGTPVYVAPEVLDGTPHSPASDLYALGVTLHTLLTGERPFHGASLVSMVREKTSGRPPSPRRTRPECPRWLDAFVSRLMEARPEDRWPDAVAAWAAWERRRAPSRRRIRRTLTASVIAMVTLGTIGAGIGWWRGRSPSSVAVVADRVIAYGARGHELWSHVEPAARHAVVADLIGGGGREVAVGCTDPELRDGVRRSWLEILDRRGARLVRIDPGSGFMSTVYPDLSDQVVITRLAAHDLDGNGLDEVVAVLQHAQWYPSMVMSWGSRSPAVPRTLLVNSGAVTDVAFADLDANGADELIAFGLNNPLGYQAFAAIVRTDSGAVGSRSPDKYSPPVGAYGSLGGLVAYSVLGPWAGHQGLGPVDTDGIVVRQHDSELHLTAEAVPPWARAERDPDRRLEFWEALAGAGRSQIGADPDLGTIADFESRWRDQLQERPRRVAAELMIARSLAVAGELQPAIDRLTTASRALPDVGDLWLRRGELELIAGRHEAGRESLRRAVTARASGRTPFDASLMLSLDACLRADEQDCDDATLATTGAMTSWSEPLRADMEAVSYFARQEWRHPSLDPRPPAPEFPAGRVLRTWAALERGSPPSEVLEIANGLVRNPEIAPLAELLRAVALDHLERPEDARLAAGTAVAELRRRGRTSFEAAVWIPLAERVMESVTEGNTIPSARR